MAYSSNGDIPSEVYTDDNAVCQTDLQYVLDSFLKIDEPLDTTSYKEPNPPLANIPLPHLLNAELQLTRDALPVEFQHFEGVTGVIICIEDSSYVTILLNSITSPSKIFIATQKVQYLLPVVPTVGDSARIIYNQYTGYEGFVVSSSSTSSFVKFRINFGVDITVNINDLVRLQLTTSRPLYSRPTTLPTSPSVTAASDRNISPFQLCSPSIETAQTTPTMTHPPSISRSSSQYNYCSSPLSPWNFSGNSYNNSNSCFTYSTMDGTYSPLSTRTTCSSSNKSGPLYTCTYPFYQSHNGGIHPQTFGTSLSPSSSSSSYLRPPPSYWSAHFVLSQPQNGLNLLNQSKFHTTPPSATTVVSDKSSSKQRKINPVEELKSLVCCPPNKRLLCFKTKFGCPGKTLPFDTLIDTFLQNIKTKDAPDQWYCPSTTTGSNCDDLTTESIMVSAICPLTKQRMEYPCRGLHCAHLQCFDARSFLQLAIKKCTSSKNSSLSGWKCPLCNKTICPKEMYIDRYLLRAIETSNATNIQYIGKKLWEPITDAIEHTSSDVIDLTHDSDDDL